METDRISDETKYCEWCKSLGLEANPILEGLYIYFILFIKQIPNPATAGSPRINAKETQKKE